MGIIIDYASLKTAVADNLTRSDLGSFVPFFIQAAEFRIYRELRVRQMTNSVSVDIVAGDDSISLETHLTGFLECTGISVVGNVYTRMEHSSIDAAVRNFPRGTVGKPAVFTKARRTNIPIYPTSDAAYELVVGYYRRDPAMSANDDAPWLVTDAPDLILYAALSTGEQFTKNDTRVQMWESLYSGAKQSLITQEARNSTAGSKPRATFR